MSTAEQGGTQPQAEQKHYASPEQAAAAGDTKGLLDMCLAATNEAKETRMLAQMDVGKDGLEATNSAQLYWLAGMYYRSGAAPKDDMEEKVNGQSRQRSEANVRARLFIKMTFGAELGLKPLQAIQNIAVINNRPCIWGDAAKALVLQSGLAEYVYEREVGQPGDLRNPNPAWGFECVTKRKGQEEEVYRFTWGDAKIAGLLDKNQSLYKLYPKRMLMFRARGFRLRDTYPDVLKGLITGEEARDIDSERVTDSSTQIGQRRQIEQLLTEGNEKESVQTQTDTDNGESSDDANSDPTGASVNDPGAVRTQVEHETEPEKENPPEEATDPAVSEYLAAVDTLPYTDLAAGVVDPLKASALTFDQKAVVWKSVYAKASQHYAANCIGKLGKDLVAHKKLVDADPLLSDDAKMAVHQACRKAREPKGGPQ